MYRFETKCEGVKILKKPFAAIEKTYPNDDGKTTLIVFHPAIIFKGDEEYCFFPDEDTKTGLLEYLNEDDALFNAEQLYKHYVLSKQ